MHLLHFTYNAPPNHMGYNWLCEYEFACYELEIPNNHKWVKMHKNAFLYCKNNQHCYIRILSISIDVDFV